jgi:hypothetical protein
VLKRSQRSNVHAVQARGHEVWVDVERLSAGVDWEDGIAGGLTWVKDAQHDGRVLLLMTPHALRRPDGYCLNEIARAASSRLAIFPVMVADSEPPPAINMLPFFDLRDCVPSQTALDDKSETWQEEMAAKIHSDRCWEKLQRLFAMLELVRAEECEYAASLGDDDASDLCAVSRHVGVRRASGGRTGKPRVVRVV